MHQRPSFSDVVPGPIPRLLVLAAVEVRRAPLYDERGSGHEGVRAQPDELTESAGLVPSTARTLMDRLRG